MGTLWFFLYFRRSSINCCNYFYYLPKKIWNY